MKRRSFRGRTTLGASALARAEAARQQRAAEQAHQALAPAANPHNADFLYFTHVGQLVADAAFLAHALLRAPTALRAQLPAATQQQLG